MPWNSSSFVSGHALLTVAVAVFVSHSFPRWRRSVWVFALLSLYGRVYAGIHFPTDVLAGAFLGLALGWSAVAVERRDLWKRMAARTRRTLDEIESPVCPGMGPTPPTFHPDRCAHTDRSRGNVPVALLVWDVVDAGHGAGKCRSL